MQPKPTTINYLTEERFIEILKNVLQDYPTKKELEGIVRKIVKQEVKKELKKELKKEIASSEMRISWKIEESERRYEEKAQKYRDEVLTRMDGIVGELDQHREDNLFRDHDIKILKEQTADHSKRISNIEHEIHKN